jgi:hypothetical protein
LESLLGSVSTIVVSAAVAVVTWIAANFFAEPLLSFYKRRRMVRESLLYVANVRNDISKPEVYDAVCNELRRHAAAIEALDETAPSLIKFWFRKKNYDLREASDALIGFSNELSSTDGSRAKFRDRIQSALRYSRNL